MKVKFMTIIDRKPAQVKFKSNKEELVGFTSGVGKIKSQSLGKIKFDYIVDLEAKKAYIGVTLFNDSESPVIYDFTLNLLRHHGSIIVKEIDGDTAKTWGVPSIRFDFDNTEYEDYNRLVQLLSTYIVKDLIVAS